MSNEPHIRSKSPGDLCEVITESIGNLVGSVDFNADVSFLGGRAGLWIDYGGRARDADEGIDLSDMPEREADSNLLDIRGCEAANPSPNSAKTRRAAAEVSTRGIPAPAAKSRGRHGGRGGREIRATRKR